VEFECNAPFYISYLINKKRLEAYEKQYGREKAWIHIKAKEPGLQNESISLNPTSQPTLFAHLIAPLDSDFSICLASDGVTSFSIEQDNTASESIPTDKIVSDCMAYKNFQGEFVQRRVTKVLKEYNKLNIRHFDDLSFATIHFAKDSNEAATSVHTENGQNHPN
jgi:hypothetical protein